MNSRLLVLASLVVAAVIAFQCQKRQAPLMSEYGWDNCDADGLSCCYFLNATSGQTIVLYSHGYDEGQYSPNTHCNYVIDFDGDCNIHLCMQLDFSMNPGDTIKVHQQNFQMGIYGNKQPSNMVLDGNRASIDFTSVTTPPEGSKWSMGLVCIPKTEYKSICEVCDEMAEDQLEGPDDGETVKVI